MFTQQDNRRKYENNESVAVALEAVMSVSDSKYSAKRYFLSVSCARALCTVRAGDILSSNNSKHVALEIMSSGSFGKVAKRLSLETKNKDGGCEDGWGPHLYRPG